MSQIVPMDQKFANVQNLLMRSQKQLGLALPRHITPDRMLRVVLTSIRRTPELLECDPLSLLGAVFQSSQLGLEPDGVTGQAYLIPFFNGKTQRKEVQFIPGYRGLIDLARRSGRVSTIYARAVHERDAFRYSFGLEEKLEHTPSDEANPGPLTHVYAVCRMTDGSVQFEVMNRAEVDAIRNRSKAKGSGPWVTDYEEMAKKTVLRRMSKMLPVSVEMQAAISLDEQEERGIPQDLGSLVPMEIANPGMEVGQPDQVEATTSNHVEISLDTSDSAPSQAEGGRAEPPLAAAAATPAAGAARTTTASNGAPKARRL